MLEADEQSNQIPREPETTEGPSLHPQPPVSNDALQELEVVESGYGPLYQDLEESLGKASLNSVDINEALSEAEVGKNNYQLLMKLAELLPKAEQNRFDLEGQDIQYRLRQIQANVVSVNARPHFIIGRHDLSDSEVEVMLLKAVNDSHNDARWKVTIVPVRKDALAHRDQTAEAIEGKALSEGEIDYLRQHGKISAMAGTHIVSTEDRNLKPPEQYDSGSVKYQIWKATGYDEHSPLIPTEVFDKFSVNTYIAKLALAFGVEDKLRQALKPVEGSSETRPLTYWELEQQNQQLRSTLKDMLLAAGVAETDTDSIIEAKLTGTNG